MCFGLNMDLLYISPSFAKRILSKYIQENMYQMCCLHYKDLYSRKGKKSAMGNVRENLYDCILYLFTLRECVIERLSDVLPSAVIHWFSVEPFILIIS